MLKGEENHKQTKIIRAASLIRSGKVPVYIREQNIERKTENKKEKRKATEQS